jgi:uncharacterized membrane protein YdbT with pleckstrin-like domain
VPKPYRESLLAADERIALITRPHALTFWGRGLRGVVLAFLFLGLALFVQSTTALPAEVASARPILVLVLLAFAAIAALSVGLAWVQWRAHEIVVTDRRVIRISGVLSKDVIDYSLDAITDLHLRQSWLGRLLNYGDVDILTAGEPATRPRDTFPVVAGPITFTHAVEQQREWRRRGFGQSGGAASTTGTVR